MHSELNFNSIMHESTFSATHSSVLDDYYTSGRKVTRHSKKELQFPNSESKTLKLLRRSIHKPDIEQSNSREDDESLDNISLDISCPYTINNKKREVDPLDDDDDSDTKSSPVNIKYSWEDLDNWIPPSEREKLNDIHKSGANIENEKIECRKKYSRQVSSQTSFTVIDDYFQCDRNNRDIEYLWQINGIGTQASLHDNDTKNLQSDYWNGRILSSDKSKYIPTDLNGGNVKNIRKSGGCNKNKTHISYSLNTQTLADKSFQTELNDRRMKKLWRSFKKRYLPIIKCSPIHTRNVSRVLLKMERETKNTNVSVLDEDDLFEELNSTLTDEPFPLNDNLNQSCGSDSNCIVRNEHEDELIARLALARDKIKNYEDSIDKISSSISQIKIDNDISINCQYQHVPINIKNDINSVISYIQEHIKKLEEQFKDLDNADYQITNTTEQVLKEIDCSYERLASQVIREINQRRDLMRLEAKVFQKESLGPLKACRKEIKTQIFNKNQSILRIEKLLKDSSERGVVNSDIEEILNANRNIGGIPAVPSTDELPYLTFKPPMNTSLNDFLEKIHDLGSVLRLGPAEIIEIEEKPASVFVKWDITNPEFAGEEQIYVLQKANGKIFDPAADVFETVYEGPETCTFVRNLLVNQPITLRIGIQSLASAWSAPRIVKTQMSNYRWSNDNKDYMIKDRIAGKIADNTSTLFSAGPQIDSNQIIEFEFLKVPRNGTNDEGIGLVVDPKDKDDNLRRSGVLLITSYGEIFMDGEEKLMRLPEIKLGTKIIFTILRKKDKCLRINIECDEKAVTYDWPVQTPLCFAARFSGHDKWHLMVK